MKLGLENAIKIALERHAMLFAGAGFSYGALNIHEESFSTESLKERLLIELGENKEEYRTRSFGDIAGFYLRKRTKQDLITTLKDVFTVREVKDFHRTIVALPWRRIYTTNYDRVIEMAAETCEKDGVLSSVSISDDYDVTSKQHVCIHLNGYIERINEDNLNDEFKLLNRSYSASTLVGNPWFSLFENDINVFRAIIVVGYSMQYDLDIMRLMSTPTIKEKVIFVDKPDLNEMDRIRLEDYGECFTIGIEGFAKKIHEVEDSFIPLKQEEEYTCFRAVRDDKFEGTARVTLDELWDFYAKGRFSEKLLRRDPTHQYMYMIQRYAYERVMSEVRGKDHGVCLILSRLGNGKTIFLKLLENALRQAEGLKCFTFIHRYDEIEDEVRRIVNTKGKIVVIIDDYPGYLDVLSLFSTYKTTSLKFFFVLSVRTGMHRKMEQKMLKALRIKRQDCCLARIDELKDTEIIDLANVLKQNQLESSDAKSIKYIIEGNCQRQISNVVLHLFGSSHIKKELEKLYSNLCDSNGKADRKLRNVVVFSLLNVASHYGLSFSEIVEIFEADYVEMERDDNEFMTEIFTDIQGQEGLQVRSSIVADYLLHHVIPLRTTLEVMEEAFIAADRREGATYKELQKAMLSHSQIVQMVKEAGRGMDAEEDYIRIKEYYESVRMTEFASKNPFFWEQFASAYLDIRKFELAKHCLDYAYRTAQCLANSKFVPYHISTIEGRYLVEKCLHDLNVGYCNGDEAVNQLHKATDIMLKYYDHEDFRNVYVFRQAGKYPDVFDLIADKITSGNASLYVQCATQMERKMSEYLNSTEQSPFDIEDVRKWRGRLTCSIEKAKDVVNHTFNKAFRGGGRNEKHF